MDPIYVTGHRNPDTDSIVAAISYAALRNALGDREFVPARLGHISDETRLVLGRFGFEPPIRIQTMRTQVRDLDYDTPPALSGAVTVSRAWTALQNNRSIPAIPVTNDNGELYGMLSPSEIASYDMRTLSDSRVDRIPVFNLLSVLDGKIINEVLDNLPASLPKLRKIARKCEDSNHPYRTVADVQLAMEKHNSSQLYVFICVFIILMATLLVWLTTNG